MQKRIQMRGTFSGRHGVFPRHCRGQAPLHTHGCTDFCALLARGVTGPPAGRVMPVAIMITEGPGPRVIAVFDVTAGRKTGSTLLLLLGGKGSFVPPFVALRVETSCACSEWGRGSRGGRVATHVLGKIAHCAGSWRFGGANGTMLWSGTCTTQPSLKLGIWRKAATTTRPRGGWRWHAAGTRATGVAASAMPTAATGSATGPALGPASGRAAAREGVAPLWRASSSVAAGPVAVRRQAPPARGRRRAGRAPPYVPVEAAGTVPPARRLLQTTRRHAVAIRTVAAAIAPATGASTHVRLGLLGRELRGRVIAIVRPELGLILEQATFNALRGEVKVL